MNMNWKKKMNRRWIAKPKGFTLIEFLVASALAIIVILVNIFKSEDQKIIQQKFYFLMDSLVEREIFIKTEQ